MKKVVLFLADGFEEVEALTSVDLLRRAGIDLKTMAIQDLAVQGAHGIEVKADLLFDPEYIKTCDAMILPGGMPGTKNLQEHKGLEKELLEFAKEKKIIAAICAAPMVMGRLGLLKGRKACCHPGYEENLLGAQLEDGLVSVDENYVTSRGVGTAIAFALRLIEILKDKETADQVKESIVY